MIAYSTTTNFDLSSSPHSIGLQNAITTPSSWGDSNQFIRTEKRFLASGLQGLGCPTCTSQYGLNGLGDLQSIIDSLSNLTIWDWIGIIGVSYFALMMFEGKPSRYGK